MNGWRRRRRKRYWGEIGGGWPAEGRAAPSRERSGLSGSSTQTDDDSAGVSAKCVWDGDKKGVWPPTQEAVKGQEPKKNAALV